MCVRHAFYREQYHSDSLNGSHSYFAMKFILSVCAMEASSFHIKRTLYAENWTRIGFQTICDVTNPAHSPASYNQIINEHRESVMLQKMNVKTAS